MSAGFALFKDAFTRLLDMEVGREFNLLLKDFMIKQARTMDAWLNLLYPVASLELTPSLQDMNDFVNKLEAMCMVPPERQELLAVVKNVLPPQLQEPYAERLGLTLMKSAEKQMVRSSYSCLRSAVIGGAGSPLATMAACACALPVGFRAISLSRHLTTPSLCLLAPQHHG